MSNQDQKALYHYHCQFLRLGSGYRETVCIEGMEGHRLRLATQLPSSAGNARAVRLFGTQLLPI